MMAKAIAGKMMSACSHSVPVLVPCAGCVEKHLADWERRIRDDVKRTVVDDINKAMDDSVRWKAESERVKRGHEALLETMRGLREANHKLSGALGVAKHEAESLRAQLHADQASKQVLPQYRVIEE